MINISFRNKSNEYKKLIITGLEIAVQMQRVYNQRGGFQHAFNRRSGQQRNTQLPMCTLLCGFMQGRV